jgi:hypothetical protein
MEEKGVAVNLFTFVGLYVRALDTASHLLAKGMEFAQLRNAPESELLEWRLVDDMLPFGFQLRVVTNFACQWPARVAGLPVPDDIPADLDAAGFTSAIANAKSYLATLTPDQFAGRDEVPLTFRIADGLEPTLPAEQWLTVFATTNLYFHLSTAYGILRAKGVHIGKVDLFASGL